MAKFKQPRKFNPVSFLFLLALVALGYATVQFGPPYWRQFKVKQVLRESGSRYAKFPASEEGIRKRALAKIKQVGVEDGAVRVWFKRTGKLIDVWAEYKEVVQHPLVNKITTMNFAPSVTVKDERLY